MYYLVKLLIWKRKVLSIVLNGLPTVKFFALFMVLCLLKLLYTIIEETLNLITELVQEILVFLINMRPSWWLRDLEI